MYCLQIDGVKFYGTPWHPNPGYPFYADRNGGLATKWERIPNDTDVLITHTPPVGMQRFQSYKFQDIWICTQMRSIGVVDICWRGSKLWLRSEFLILFQQQYFIFHVFGHVHYCNGAVSNGITVRRFSFYFQYKFRLLSTQLNFGKEKFMKTVPLYFILKRMQILVDGSLKIKMSLTVL